jgi:hypothetical protein
MPSKRKLTSETNEFLKDNSCLNASEFIAKYIKFIAPHVANHLDSYKDLDLLNTKTKNQSRIITLLTIVVLLICFIQIGRKEIINSLRFNQAVIKARQEDFRDTQVLKGVIKQ